MDVGSQLRRIRTRAGLSQRQLAKRAGIPNSTVSLMESNSVNPSVGALKRILDAFPISLAEFFTPDPSEREKIVYRADELTEIGKGKISLRQIGSSLEGRSLQLLHECYEPGGDTGRIPLTHNSEEGGFVIQGILEVTVADERYELHPGDAYYFDSSRPHRFRCVGSEPCEVLSACTPPSF